MKKEALFFTDKAEIGTERVPLKSKRYVKGGKIKKEYPIVELQLYADNTQYNKKRFSQKAYFDFENDNIKFVGLDTFGEDYRMKWIKVQEKTKGYCIKSAYFGGVVYIENYLQLWNEYNKKTNPKMANGGLIAPNGNPSKLTLEQYKLVRTPEFKAWFGDWQNDPENASKVVDSNGEPLVCYHGTDVEFNEFDKNKIASNNPTDKAKLGFWFTSDLWEAEGFAYGFDESMRNENGRVITSFLNIREPLDIESNTVQKKLDKKYSKDRDIAGMYIEGNQIQIKQVLNKKNDGIVLSPIFIVFESNQIKLADGTNTTFDGNNSDIRFKDGGSIDSERIDCQKCDWSWKVADGGDDLYVCHKCGYDNEPYYANKFAGGGSIDNSTNVKPTEDLIHLVKTEREKAINEWRKHEKVVVGRNDGYWWYNDSSTDANFEIASNPSRRKILEIIKNNPSINELGFQGTIKVGSRVGEELEIVDDFSVTLWSKNNEFFKEGMTFEYSSDNGKYKYTIVNKNETEYKDRVDKKKFVYFKSVDKYGNIGEERQFEFLLKEDFEDGKAFFVDKMAGGGGIDINEPFSVNGKTLAERVRILVKQLYPDYKWSVTSSYTKMDVYLLQADFDPFTEKWKEEHPEGRLQYNVDDRDLRITNSDSRNISDRAVEVFKPIREYIDKYVENYNAGDPYADYSNYNVYEYTYIGKWDKPYVQVEPKAGKKAKAKSPVTLAVTPTTPSPTTPTTPTPTKFAYETGDIVAITQEKLNSLSFGIAAEVSQYYFEIGESINQSSRSLIRYNEYNESETGTVEVLNILENYVKATVPLFKMGDTVVKDGFPNNPLKIVHRVYYQQTGVKYSTPEKRFLLSGMYWNYALEDATYANEDELDFYNATPITATQEKGLPSIDPQTWHESFKVGDKVKIRWDFSNDLGLPATKGNAKVDYFSNDNNFTIVRIDKRFQEPEATGGIQRPENPTGLLYVLSNKQSWEGKDLELVDGTTNTPSATPTTQPQYNFLDYLTANTEKANKFGKDLEISSSFAMFVNAANQIENMPKQQYAELMSELLDKFPKTTN